MGLCLSLASPTRAAAPAPAVAAEQVRAALFAAQHELMNEAGGSKASFANAQSTFSQALLEFMQAVDPAAAQRATSGFSRMDEAVQVGDPIAFASARAQTWTAILAGSYSIIELSLIEGNLETAQAWLLVREFRSATRFSSPNADATRALQGLISGDLKHTAAIQFARADLLDSYQARMNEALNELEVANTNGFLVRQAELAGLAEGYFYILASVYAQQRAKFDGS
jgi:high-affinity iron transporter